MSDSSASPAPVADYFRRVVSEHGERGPVGDVLRQLADDTLTAAEFDRIVTTGGLSREQWFRGQILDLFLGFLRDLLTTSRLSAEHRALIHGLRHRLAIVDGECFQRRPAEVAAIVDEQLDRILEDGIIDGAEELEQVELQAALGLAYDDYLLVSRRALERIHTELTQFAHHDPESARKLRILEPIYALAASRPRSLGARF